MRPRQTLPKVYRRAGSIYVSRRGYVMQSNSLVGEPCLGVLVPPHTAVDIDSPLDLELAKILLSSHKTPKSLMFSFIAELCQNHNGDFDTVLRMVDAA